MEFTPSPTILFIQKLPAELSCEETTDLLKYFGAISVSVMSPQGHMKGCAFTEFPTLDEANIALKKLHQAPLFGSRLIVQFSNKNYMPVDSTESLILPEPPKPQENAATSNDESRLPSSNPDPSLHYLYPPPTQNTLNNISHALVAVPQFYIQVLHLMNKMNLPPPFSHSSEKSIFECSESIMHPPLPSSSESEMESDHEPADQTDLIEKEILAEKRIATQAFIDCKSSEPDRKRKKESTGDIEKNQTLDEISAAKVNDDTLITDMPLNKNKVRESDKNNPAPVENLTKVSIPVDISSIPLPPNFNKDIAPKIQLNSNATVMTSNALKNHDKRIASSSLEGNFDNYLGVPPAEIPYGGSPPPYDISAEQETSSTTLKDDKVLLADNSPKNYHTNKSSDNESTVLFEKFRASLRNKCMDSEKLGELNVFKKYSKGDPSSKLYLKNLNHKLVQEKDLIEIFKPYFDFYKINVTAKEQLNDVEIKIMTRGQMKGQAFVTLPSLEAATTALSDLHGYLLYEKPMAIMYAKSK